MNDARTDDGGFVRGVSLKVRDCSPDLRAARPLGHRVLTPSPVLLATLPGAAAF
jgi:hypothetical protein